MERELDAVRNIGNFAAHTQKSTVTGAILDVVPGEAEWNLDVLASTSSHGEKESRLEPKIKSRWQTRDSLGLSSMHTKESRPCRPHSDARRKPILAQSHQSAQAARQGGHCAESRGEALRRLLLCKGLLLASKHRAFVLYS